MPRRKSSLSRKIKNEGEQFSSGNERMRSDNLTLSTNVKEEPDDSIEECSMNTEEEISTVLVKVEPLCDTEEAFQDEDSWKEEAFQVNEACPNEEEEELECPATVFIKTEALCETEEESWNEEAFQVNKPSQDGGEEILENPVTVFVKAEAVNDVEAFCDAEDSWNEEAFLENEASQNEEEEILGLSDAVFLEPVVNKEEDSRAKKEPRPPCNESVFLASIKKKIGAILPGGGPFNESPAAGGPDADLVCVCGEHFLTEEAATAHAQTHPGAKPFRCTICNQHFLSSRFKVWHMTSHAADKPLQMWRNPYECDICKKKFRHKEYLFIHMRTHTGATPLQCNLCKKNFRHRHHLFTHACLDPGMTHCDICNLNFTEKGFKSHMRNHRDVEIYQCGVCEKIFEQKGDLVRHMRIHTGEKPFQCYVCQKNFRQKGHLFNHMCTHTDENPFHCNVCNTYFKQREDLIAHTRIDSGGEPYQCKACKKKFSQCSGLKAHMLTHTGKSLKKLFK